MRIWKLFSCKGEEQPLVSRDDRSLSFQDPEKTILMNTILKTNNTSYWLFPYEYFPVIRLVLCVMSGFLLLLLKKKKYMARN